MRHTRKRDLDELVGVVGVFELGLDAVDLGREGVDHRVVGGQHLGVGEVVAKDVLDEAQWLLSDCIVGPPLGVLDV